MPLSSRAISGKRTRSTAQQNETFRDVDLGRSRERLSLLHPESIRLEAIAAERAINQAVEDLVEVVWTGPESIQSATRDTGVVRSCSSMCAKTSDRRIRRLSSETGSRAPLHAKCVVVDGSATFVTSANFTRRFRIAT
jgi:phosphatidylserine/phosphatidylglycerophosphate/cardiolipin synthase-like enzyme